MLYFTPHLTSARALPGENRKPCRELCKNVRIHWDVVWVVDSGGPKEACVTWGCTFAQPG